MVVSTAVEEEEEGVGGETDAFPKLSSFHHIGVVESVCFPAKNLRPNPPSPHGSCPQGQGRN